MPKENRSDELEFEILKLVFFIVTYLKGMKSPWFVLFLQHSL